MALTVLIFQHGAVSVFSASDTGEDAKSRMANALPWTALLFLFDAWQIVFVHALRELRRVVGPMLISSASHWAVGLDGGYCLPSLWS